MKSITKSWKTTVAGILQFLSVVSVQFGYLLDADPVTAPDYSLIVSSAVILVGLFTARDNDVSSEDAGAPIPKEEPKTEV